MKTRLPFAGPLLLLFCFANAGAVAAAELQIPEQFDVLVVNGEEASSSFSRTKILSLPAGRNVVIVEYDQIFDADFGDSHDRIRSAPFALVFTAAETDRLRVTAAQPKSGADARLYAKKPAVQLLNDAGKAVAMEQLPVTELAGALVINSPPAPVATSQTIIAPADALQMLSYWWQQATPEQRAAFLQEITP